MLCSMDEGDKVRENRVRATARRRGMQLEKNRVRDPRAIGYGTYRLTDLANGWRLGRELLEDGFGLTLDEADWILNGDRGEDRDENNVVVGRGGTVQVHPGARVVMRPTGQEYVAGDDGRLIEQPGPDAAGSRWR
jgi:hypothetical protein